MDQRPFEGINVLDFSWAGVAPLSVNYLSFYGATVVKVESHERPDPLRTLAPFRDGIPSPERSYHFAYTQMSKRYSATLNLEHPKGLELIGISLDEDKAGDETDVELSCSVPRVRGDYYLLAVVDPNADNPRRRLRLSFLPG